MNLLEELNADFSVFYQNAINNNFIFGDILPRLNVIIDLCNGQKADRALLNKQWSEIYKFVLAEGEDDLTGVIDENMSTIENLDSIIKKILALTQQGYDKLFELANPCILFDKFRINMNNFYSVAHKFQNEFSAIEHDVSELYSFANYKKFIDKTILELHKNSLLNFRVPRKDKNGQKLQSTSFSKDGLICCLEDLINLDDASYKNIFKTKNTEQNTNIETKDCVFIGHGHNLLWARIALYIIDKLKIQPVYYESECRVGNYVNKEIESFVNNPNIHLAIITMMKEDELKDGSFQPRPNTIDEAARFSQKLGKEKVAIIAEEGVTIPSNLQGIEVIIFNNNIDAIFHKIKEFLDRENLNIKFNQ